MGIGSSVEAVTDSVKSVIESGRKFSSARSFILHNNTNLLRCLQDESGCIVEITPYSRRTNVLRLVKFAIDSKLYSSSS